MIGGCDILIPTHGCTSATVLEVSVRSIIKHWPHAIIQDGDSETPYVSFSAVPFDTAHELFVHRDEAARLAVDEQGSTAETEDLFIHLIHRTGDLTMVVGKRDGHPVPAIVGAIEQQLSVGVPRGFYVAA